MDSIGHPVPTSARSASSGLSLLMGFRDDFALLCSLSVLAFSRGSGFAFTILSDSLVRVPRQLEVWLPAFLLLVLVKELPFSPIPSPLDCKLSLLSKR